MTSHHQNNVTPFPADHARPRYVTPIPEERLARAMADDQMIAAIDERLRGPARHVVVRAGWFAEVRADAREALRDPAFTFYLGGYFGCVVTVALAFVWSVLS